MIDVDSDQSYALALIEGIAALGGAMVVAYSKRNDPELLLSCMKAGAREFLPLPDDAEMDIANSSRTATQDSAGAESVRASGLKTAAEIRPETSVPDGKAAGAQSQPRPRDVRQPDPAPLDFNAWDDAHLRPLQRGTGKGPEKSPQPETTPQPPAKSERKQDSVWIRPAPQSVATDTEANARLEISPETPVKSEKEWDSVWIRPAPLSGLKGAKGRSRSGTVPEPAASMKSAEAGLQSKSLPQPSVKTESWLDAIDNATQTNTRPRPHIDRSAIEPIFHYVEPDHNKKFVRHPIYLLILAAGSGMLVGSLLLVYMHPLGQRAVDAPAAHDDVSQPVASTVNHSGRSVAKPSAAVPGVKAVAPDASTQTNPVASDMMDAQLAAPPRITSDMKKPVPVEEPPAGFAPGGIDVGGSVPGPVFGSGSNVKVVPDPSRISAGVAEGMLIHKTAPVYPQFAKDSHMSGTVILSATITKTGTLQGLRVISGPALFRNPALDAVKNWRYRPYMLDNKPVEVGTTVRLVFSLDKQ